MRTSLQTLHHRYQEWTGELEFYKQELNLLKSRLEEVAQKNTAANVLVQIEHFQNKFVIESEQLDILKHDIRIQLDHTEKQIKDRPEHTNEKSVIDDDALTNRLERFKELFAMLRLEFNKFLSATL